MDLAALQTEMKEEDLVAPRMVAVVSELTSVDGFIKCWSDDDGQPHEVYLDESNGFKKALGSGKSGLHALLYPSVWEAAKRTKAKYENLESDLKGDGLWLGGSMVVGAGEPGEVLFAYNEKQFGDLAAPAEIKSIFEQITAAGSRQDGGAGATAAADNEQETPATNGAAA